MPKKSNKTSHVLNLLTNRTGLSADDLEHSVLPQEVFVKKQIEKQIEKQVEKPKTAIGVSERIRLNLEKIERKERAGMSIERLNKNVIPAVPPAKPYIPRVDNFAPERFDAPEPESEDKSGGESEEEPEEEPPAATVAPATPEPPKKAEPQNERECTDQGKSMQGLILVNILEEVFRLEVPKIMEEFGMCTCDRCITDVLALALNSMAPKYVVSQRGALFAKISSYGNQYKIDIFTHLSQACEKVKKSPSHS